MHTTRQILAVAMCCVVAVPALALEFGANITQFDGQKEYVAGWPASYNAWWDRALEDQEVEPVCEALQKWDLEGAFLKDGHVFTMVGGFDFANGARDYTGYLEVGGDVFLNTDADAAYEFVLDMDFSTLTYGLYGGDFTVQSVNYRTPSNPWRRLSGGTFYGSGVIGWQTGSDADVGFTGGGTHYIVSLDLDILRLAQVYGDVDFTTHYTYECGNDLLVGGATAHVPDGGMTAIMLGCVVLGAEVFRRRLGRNVH